MKWVLPGNQFFENKVRYLPVRKYYDKTIQNGVRHRISSYKVILIDRYNTEQKHGTWRTTRTLLKI